MRYCIVEETWPNVRVKCMFSWIYYCIVDVKAIGWIDVVNIKYFIVLLYSWRKTIEWIDVVNILSNTLRYNGWSHILLYYCIVKVEQTNVLEFWTLRYSGWASILLCYCIVKVGQTNVLEFGIFDLCEKEQCMIPSL